MTAYERLDEIEHVLNALSGDPAPSATVVTAPRCPTPATNAFLRRGDDDRAHALILAHFHTAARNSSIVAAFKALRRSGR